MANRNEEDLIQASIVQWFNNTYCLKFHNPRYLILSIPNGGTRNKIEAMKLSATGLLAGVSDLIVVIPDSIYFVEIKTTDIKKSKQSDEQIEFQERVELLGFEYHIIRSLEQFKQLIWLNAQQTE